MSAENGSLGRLITVCGVKGGVGATTVAVNLSVALSTKGNVLLVPSPGESAIDLGLWFGVEEVPPAGDIGDVLTSGLPELLEPTLQVLTPRVSLINLDGLGDGADAGDFGALLHIARRRFSDVVVDAGGWGGARVADNVAAAMNESAVTLAVVTPDPLSIRRAKDFYAVVRAMGRPVVGVLNRVSGGGGRSVLDVAAWSDALAGLNIVGSIREAEDLPRAMLQGRVLEMMEEDSSCSAEMRRISALVESYENESVDSPEIVSDASYETSAFLTTKTRIHERFLEATRNTRPADLSDRNEVRGRLTTLLEEEGMPDLTPGFRDRLLKELMDDVTGLGPLQDLIDDPETTEVMVNGPKAIYVERRGRIERINRTLGSEVALRGIIERIVSPLGRRIDEASPLVDARLPDGSRVNAIIPPLALAGACLTIRKFSRKRLTIDDLVAGNSMTEDAAGFLRACVGGKINILISGGTGSGKTTLLNVVSSFIGTDERIVTIEDAAELRLPQDHVVPLESRPPNLEGRGAVAIRDLVRNALRMRPDRIVVGEVRGGEALDMLQAMNTGHEGSLSTLHANSPRDALARMETMVLTAGVELPLRAIREQIASAIDIVVQIARMKDGSRRLTRIVELAGLEGDVYRLQDIFVRTAEGSLNPVGLIPRVSEKLEERGHPLPVGMFG